MFCLGPVRPPILLFRFFAGLCLLFGSLPAFALHLDQQEMEISVIPGTNHLPVVVGVGGFSELGDVTVSSDVDWMAGRVDLTTEKVMLTFSTSELPGPNQIGTITVSEGEQEAQLQVRATVAALNLVRLVDDPWRLGMYGVHEDADRIGSLVIFDPADGGIRGNLTVGQRPTDLAISPDGGELLVLSSVSRWITAIDLSELRITETIPLPAFENRSFPRAGGNIAYGPGEVIYYTDHAFAPMLRVLDRRSGSVFQATLNAGWGFGNFALSHDHRQLLAWANNRPNSNLASSFISSFAVAPDGTLSFESGTSSRSISLLRSDPHDSPVLISRDNRMVVVKQAAVETSLIHERVTHFPSPACSMTPDADLVATNKGIYDFLSGERLYELPVFSRVQAFTSDYSRFFYFNHQERTLKAVDLLEEVGLDRMGRRTWPEDGSVALSPKQLQWLPLDGVRRYHLYFGESEEEVVEAGPASAPFLGEIAGLEYDLGPSLLPGTTYYWRVDALSAEGAIPGEVKRFTVMLLDSSPTEVSAITVGGHRNYPLLLELTSEEAGLDWSLSADVPWIEFPIREGVTPAAVHGFLNTTALEAGAHSGVILVAGPNGVSEIPVTLRVEPLSITLMQSASDASTVYAVSETNIGLDRAYLLKIDSEKEEVTSVIRVGSSVTDLAIHRKEGRLYLTNWLTGYLLAYDMESLDQVDSYKFAPFGGAGTGGDVYRVAPGVEGRVILEENDQSIIMRLLDTGTGAIAGQTTFVHYVRQGGGASDPTGRYYYHGENNSSAASLRKYDLMADHFTHLGSVRVTSGDYYGSRVVIVSDDGSRIFWNGSVFNSDLIEEWEIGTFIYSTSSDGRLAFGEKHVFDVEKRQAIWGMPSDAKVSAFNSSTQKLIVQVRGEVGFYDASFPIPLPAPELDVTGVGSTSVDLGWTDRSLEFGFTLQFRKEGSSAWSDVGLERNRTTHTLGGLTSETSYEFRIRADALENSSAWSHVVRAQTLPPTNMLAAPTFSPLVVEGPHSIRLGWTISSGLSEFIIIERRREGSEEWVIVAEVPAEMRAYLDENLEANTNYTYRLKAAGAGGESDYTGQLTAKTRQVTQPLAPQMGPVYPSSKSSLLISWQTVALAEGYDLYFRSQGALDWTHLESLGPLATSYVHTGLSTGETYEYQLSAWNEIGTSTFAFSEGTPSDLKVLLRDAFEPEEDARMWHQISAGQVVDGGLGFDTGGALWFGSAAAVAETRAVDVREGGFLHFVLRAGNAARDGPDYWSDFATSQTLTVQYSLNGLSWMTLQNISLRYPQLTNWTPFVIPLPSAAHSATTRFRWRLSTSAPSGNWAVDNVEVRAPEPAPIPVVENLQPTVLNSTTVHLSWPPPRPAGLSSDIDPAGVYQFAVERRLDGKEWELIAVIEGSLRPGFADSAVPAVEVVSYRVTTLAPWEESKPSSAVTVVTMAQLDEWRLMNFGTTSNTGPAADLARDSYGVANLQRFAFGLDVDERPRVFEPGSSWGGMPFVWFEEATARLNVRFMRRRRDLNPEIEYVVEYSSTLEEWLAFDVPGSVSRLSDLWEEVHFEQPSLPEFNERGFVRVRIVRPHHD
jgi:DNA-binding beta-propeller fold protein YncE